ncbi:MAG: redoxin domain-containing protein [Pseudomonadota bacterium]
MILPGSQAPNLTFPLQGGGTWHLHEQQLESFTMILVYRGVHCSICRGLLKTLNGKVDDFTALGTDIVIVSTDDEARADRAKSEWGIDNLNVGYRLSIEDAYEWRLFVSPGNENTPPKYSEPGLFLIRPDGELFYASIQSSPFGRSSLDEIRAAIEFARKTDYPSRGSLAG